MTDEFVYLDEVIDNIIVELRYFSDYNFVGRRIKGYEGNYAILTKVCSEQLKLVSSDLSKMGYGIKIYDAYRPVMAVEDFLEWSKNDDCSMKNEFYPNLEKKEIIEKKLIDNKSAHSRGSTVDLTLYKLDDLSELDMGSSFDMFDEVSSPYYTGITQEQYNNRKLLRDVMEKYGFKVNNREWWHFTLDNEPFFDTYFNFIIKKY